MLWEICFFPNNVPQTQSLSLFSPVPKVRLVEGSEFLNEQDAAKVGRVSGLNGKSNQWSFEELIDLNVHPKTRPLIEAEDCNQVLINCDGNSDGTRVAFEDKATPVSTLHSSNQPIEALSGEQSFTLSYLLVNAFKINSYAFLCVFVEIWRCSLRSLFLLHS